MLSDSYMTHFLQTKHRERERKPSSTKQKKGTKVTQITLNPIHFEHYQIKSNTQKAKTGTGNEIRVSKNREGRKEDTSDILYLRFSSAYSKSTNSLLLRSFKSTHTEVDADAKVDALKLLQWREILCPLVKIYGDKLKENTLFARSNGLVEDVEQA